MGEVEADWKQERMRELRALVDRGAWIPLDSVTFCGRKVLHREHLTDIEGKGRRERLIGCAGWSGRSDR